MKNRILYFIVNPYFLSFLLTLIVIFFILPDFNKYRFQLADQFISKDVITHYQDLNNDNYSERITFFNVPQQLPRFLVYEKGKILGVGES